ncbi:protein PYRICULARIA ORYZAE RESISTANCE 21-like [Phragmites australis]|uniref:protein PYRICULARIA ORYZAE RESISTANCE 21-like n=1 Tax=Phragmites australis TaxID=29695 RepID=UPI002D77A669|nr:protein PYRICULARIA ORYZAE RESISTANCE 21-like [Phragmites australis]
MVQGSQVLLLALLPFQGAFYLLVASSWLLPSPRPQALILRCCGRQRRWCIYSRHTISSSSSSLPLSTDTFCSHFFLPFLPDLHCSCRRLSTESRVLGSCAVQMPTIIVKVDLECSRCYAKIQKVLNRIQEKGEFCIDDIEYDEKNNRVVVSGPFDAEKLADKLCCKACKIIKEIEIVEPPPPPEPKKDEPKKEEPQPPAPKPEVVPAPPPTVVVEPPPPSPKKEEPKKEEPKKEEPKPPAPKVVEIPYPWPYPYPFPAWPSDCCCHHGHGGCHCCSCGKAPEPAPPPPQPQYTPMPQYVPQPYPCGPCGGGGYRIVCEEDPSYACIIM